ncbi:MAG: FAD-binding protein [Desulfuromonadales bacterium]|nr:FAD-binding protein [Desulfuromonadales bacterium]
MERLLAVINEEFRGEVRREEPMLSHTSWRIGGPAKLFLIPQDAADLRVLLGILERFRVEWMVIGHGTSLLVKDGGFAGAMISLERFDTIEMKMLGRIDAGAGVSLAQLVRQAAENGLTGLEELSGIPGSVGGALVKNSSSGTAEIASLVESVTLADENGARTISGAPGETATGSLPGQAVVTSAVFRLQRGRSGEETDTARGGQRLNGGGALAGAVFKNPRGRLAHELIREAGLGGEQYGYAEIPAQFCNCIVNLGQATAEDVLGLIELTRKRVLEKSGVALDLNVRIVGQEIAR